MLAYSKVCGKLRVLNSKRFLWTRHRSKVSYSSKYFALWRRKQGTKLIEGMFFTIEPMINLGKKDILILDDGWTAVTRDKKLSSQYEHTIGVTKTGYEVFTISEKEKKEGRVFCC